MRLFVVDLEAKLLRFKSYTYFYNCFILAW